jgi:hypothetical protein
LYELRVDLLNLFSTNENIVSLLNKASEYNISAHVILNKISTSDVDVLRTIHNMERDIRVGGIVGAFEKTVVDPILGLVNGIVASNTSIKTVKSILAPLKKGESAIQGLYKVSSAVGLVKNFVDEAATVIPNIQSNYLVSRYKFKYFLWVGSLVAHSRPLCVHLISKGGIEQYKNVRSLVATYPQGLYKGTDETNITYLAGGHYCRHRVFPIRDPRIFI